MRDIIRILLITIISLTLFNKLANYFIPFDYGNPFLSLFYLACLIPLIVDAIIVIVNRMEIRKKFKLAVLAHLLYLLLIFSFILNLELNTEIPSDFSLLNHMLIYNGFVFVSNTIYKYIILKTELKMNRSN